MVPLSRRYWGCPPHPDPPPPGGREKEGPLSPWGREEEGPPRPERRATCEGVLRGNCRGWYTGGPTATGRWPGAAGRRRRRPAAAAAPPARGPTGKRARRPAARAGRAVW